MVKKNTVLLGLCLYIVTLMTFFSEVISAPAGNLVDVDGNRYGTVEIGRQIWMQENLNVGHYRNGDPIRHAQSVAEWYDAALKGEGAWAYYNNDPANGAKYGRLYNWYAVNDPRGLAPKGWHIPSDKEWSILSDQLGGEAVAGGKMKAIGQSKWEESTNVTGIDSNFNALPGGMRGIDGASNFIGKSAYFWSASQYASTMAWYRVLNFHVSSIVKSAEEKRDGFSVRCIKD